MQASFRSWAYALMAFIFTITTPVGVAIGIGIQSSYNPNSLNALVVSGVFDSVSTGERASRLDCKHCSVACNTQDSLALTGQIGISPACKRCCPSCNCYHLSNTGSVGITLHPDPEVFVLQARTSDDCWPVLVLIGCPGVVHVGEMATRLMIIVSLQAFSSTCPWWIL